MKKKLLLISLMVALFICVFAISVSAAIIPLDSDPGLDCDASLVSTLDIAAYGESNTATDRESRVVLTDGSKYYVFPAYYVVNMSVYYNPGGFNNILKAAMAEQGVTFSSIKECLVRIQIPTYVEEINHNTAKFENFPTLKEARWGTHLKRIHAQNATTRTAACQASLYITNSQSPPKPMSIESVMPSNHLILCRPLLLLPLIFPSIRVFSSESTLPIRWPKCWSFSFSISPSNEYSGLISFRIDWFDLLVFQGTLSLLHHHGSKAPILWHSAFQLSHLYMTTGKTIALIDGPLSAK